MPVEALAQGRDRFGRERRVQLIGEAAEALLSGTMPSPAAALFLGAALQAWLAGGGALGSLERDHLRVTGPARSRLTPARIWARCGRTATNADDGETMPVIDNHVESK